MESAIRQVELFKEIESLPQKYYGEVFDFVGYLQQKAKQENDASVEIDAYKAMAADVEREQEASEWCNGCFDPAEQP